MRMKVKIRQKFKFTATAALLAFGAGNKGYSQNTSQAMMTITATVVAGSHVSNNTISNISDQLKESNSKLSFGDLKFNISDGADFLVKQDNLITMRGKNSHWLIKTNMTEKIDDSGQVTIRITGNRLSNIPAGSFEGRHITEIHYL